ncbi:DNA polymerase III subunit beta family protein [Calidifontibacter terrae]
MNLGTDDLMTIGTLAARCGLTVSALRFYDRNEVLVPASVDPATGYRRYAGTQVADALLLASLRRIGLPVNDLRVALELRDDTEALDALLEEHVRRLEVAIDAARGEVSRIRARRVTARFTVEVEGHALREALGRVRFAVSTDPSYEVLAGVRLTVGNRSVALAATDRYRLARAPLTARATTGTGSAVLPAALVDRLLAGTAAVVSLDLLGDRITVRSTDIDLISAVVPGDYPDIDVILPDASKLAGMTRLSPLPATRSDLGGVLVRDEFLLDALGAAGDRAVLHLDGHLAPVVVVGEDGYLNLIMPIRPEVVPS